MPALEQAAMRPALIFAGVAFAMVLSAAPAHAQSRTFNCAQGPAITLTVINPTAIYADPIAQDVRQLKQVPADPTRFSDGVYAVRISPDQTEITVEIPNAQPARCNFTPPAGTRAAPPAPGKKLNFEYPQ